MAFSFPAIFLPQRNQVGYHSPAILFFFKLSSIEFFHIISSHSYLLYVLFWLASESALIICTVRPWAILQIPQDEVHLRTGPLATQPTYYFHQRSFLLKYRNKGLQCIKVKNLNFRITDLRLNSDSTCSFWDLWTINWHIWASSFFICKKARIIHLTKIKESKRKYQNCR